MSGSPILQDGKLVGAVTHVLVNDPARGYGILIEWMIKTWLMQICKMLKWPMLLKKFFKKKD